MPLPTWQRAPQDVNLALPLLMNNLKKSCVDLQPLTTIQQNNLTPQPHHSPDPLTLTVCVTTPPSTTSRQHYFHRTAPLYMERRIYFRRSVFGGATSIQVGLPKAMRPSPKAI